MRTVAVFALLLVACNAAAGADPHASVPCKPYTCRLGDPECKCLAGMIETPLPIAGGVRACDCPPETPR